jgi:hypothetical protein
MNLELEDLELLIRELVLLRKQVSALSGATAGLLTAIDRAGGWHVFDPQHQDPVARAFIAVKGAVEDMLTTRADLPSLVLGQPVVYEA